MRTFYFLLLSILCSVCSVFGQQKHKEKYLVAAVTNAHTATPFGSFSRLFTKDFHPGFEMGAGINWQTKPKHDWFQELRFGYFYHRWVQHSISIYSEFGYRYKMPLGFALEARLGGGYCRVIVANQVFTDGFDKNRQYTKITSGRSQAIITTSIGISKTIVKNNDTKVFFQYQQRIQTPFVQSYIPLLPYNMGMLGVSIPLHSSKSKK
jgi:hypothetical protein